ncbi:MAG: aminotransferase class V-fold PLP-dependent enzyme [Phycisphaerales bacterium]
MASPRTGPCLAPPEPLARDLSRLWGLDPAYCFLNHGSFGAVPRAIRQATIAAQDRLESRPIELLGRRIGELLAPSKAAVGAFLGMDPSSFGFVTNATEGVNAVLHSLEFRPGDELLTTSHVYNAVRKAMAFRARQCGATCVEVPLPLPISSPDQVYGAVVEAITPRTRLLVVDQVTSPTALIFPVERLIATCRERGIEVLVDAAHVPGMLPVHVEQLGATYWTGNLHKWCCAPKGCAVLWVDAARRADIHPATVSHFLDSGLAAEFEWQGTRDVAPWMQAGAAIAFMGQWGWDRVRAHNHQMAAWCQQMLCDRWDVEPISPADGGMLGSMCTVPLPVEVRSGFQTPEALQVDLYERHRIEVPIVDFGGRWHARASAQVYNRAEQYEALAQAMLEYTH